MTPIRSGLPPTAAPSAATPGRLSAQKAFFEIAAGKAGAVAPTAPPAPEAAPKAAAAPRPLAGPAGAGAPARPLRPGSLLDIRV